MAQVNLITPFTIEDFVHNWYKYEYTRVGGIERPVCEYITKLVDESY